MQKTKVHNLNLPEKDDYVLQTIVHLFENFSKIEELLTPSTRVLNQYLETGKKYSRGVKIWNALPVEDGNVGWINIREGVYAPTWQKLTKYEKGDLVVGKGHYYECIENGVSVNEEPAFLTSDGAKFFDLGNVGKWKGEMSYQLNDTVTATDGNQLYHYRCIKRGTTGDTEPTWSNQEGLTFIDGTVQWQVYKTAQWIERGISSEFKKFGKIYD